MMPNRARALLVAMALLGVIVPAQCTRGEDKPSSPTVEDVYKQWSFDPAELELNGKVSAAGQSNDKKLSLSQIHIALEGLSYPEAFARVLKFYADQCGAHFGYEPNRMNAGVKGKSKNGQYIFSDLRNDPRETCFVFDSGAYTVSGVLQPAREKKDTVEVILTIGVR